MSSATLACDVDARAVLPLHDAPAPRRRRATPSVQALERTARRRPAGAKPCSSTGPFAVQRSRDRNEHDREPRSASAAQDATVSVPRRNVAESSLGDRTCGGRSRPSDRDHDFPSSVTLFEVPDGLGSFGERIRPIDDGLDLARLDELLQKLQVALVRLREKGAKLLAHER